MTVEALVDEGLGNSAYLVDLGDGRALAVDAAATCERSASWRPDAGSRSRSPPTPTCTPTSSPARCSSLPPMARWCWPRPPGIGRSRIVACATATRSTWAGWCCARWARPGHTDEHLAFLLLDGDSPIGVFTGGSLIVGAAARTDLVGAERTEELARAQYRSLQRLMALPDDVAVWPTHGAGIVLLRTAGLRADQHHRAGEGHQPAAGAPRRGRVRRPAARLAGQSFPPYFRWLGEANRRGPRRSFQSR